MCTSVTDLEQVDCYGDGGWYFRWSFAYAQVLRDMTGGRITAAVRRQATVDDDEQRWVLIDQDRLDGYINFAYRALKNQRDGRLLEARLDRVAAMASRHGLHACRTSASLQQVPALGTA